MANSTDKPSSVLIASAAREECSHGECMSSAHSLTHTLTPLHTHMQYTPVLCAVENSSP